MAVPVSRKRKRPPGKKTWLMATRRLMMNLKHEKLKKELANSRKECEGLKSMCETLKKESEEWKSKYVQTRESLLETLPRLE
jgi:hypothetical protein